jgi:hypothetical protein
VLTETLGATTFVLNEQQLQLLMLDNFCMVYGCCMHHIIPAAAAAAAVVAAVAVVLLLAEKEGVSPRHDL